MENYSGFSSHAQLYGYNKNIYELIEMLSTRLYLFFHEHEKSKKDFVDHFK